MRFNEKEIVSVASEPGDKEGRIFYKGPGFRETFKERWFKLKGNLLFYFRLNEYGAVYESEPIGVIVVEQCRIQAELYAELPHTFSITFANDFDKRHYFGCQTPKQVEEWISCLKVCSYEYQKNLLKELQNSLIKRTGTEKVQSCIACYEFVLQPCDFDAKNFFLRDPLAAFSSKVSELKLEEDCDKYFNSVHLFSKANSGFTNHQ